MQLNASRLFYVEFREAAGLCLEFKMYCVIRDIFMASPPASLDNQNWMSQIRFVKNSRSHHMPEIIYVLSNVVNNFYKMLLRDNIGISFFIQFEVP